MTYFASHAPDTARRRPQTERSVHATDALVWIAIASATLPSVYGNEWKLSTGAGSIYISDLLLAVATLVSIKYVKMRTTSETLVGLLIVGIAVGAVQGAELNWIVRDCRPFAYFVAGFMIGGYITERPHTIRFGVDTAAWLVGTTTVLAIIGQVTSARIVGNDSALTNAIYYNNTSTILTSSRIQTEPVALALLVVCAALASVVMKTSWSTVASKMSLGVLVLSSVILTVLSYSRNSILGLAFTVALAVISVGYSSRLTRLRRALVTLFAALIALGVPIWIGYQYGLFENVIDTFSSRVISGIAPDALGTDPSVGWRFTETHAVIAYITDNSWWGSGFGTFYRASLAGDPFLSSDGRIYVHNFYLLIILKFGVVIGVILLLFIAVTVVRLLRTARDNIDVPVLAVLGPVGCAFAGTLATCLVTPAIHARSFAVVAGLIVYLGFVETHRARARTKT